MQPSLSGYKCGSDGPAIYCLGKYDFAHAASASISMIHCLGFEKAIERSRWLGAPIEENVAEDENGEVEVACYTTKMLVEVP